VIIAYEKVKHMTAMSQRMREELRIFYVKYLHYRWSGAVLLEDTHILVQNAYYKL
jgi:hypothetical protein